MSPVILHRGGWHPNKTVSAHALKTIVSFAYYLPLTLSLRPYCAKNLSSPHQTITPTAISQLPLRTCSLPKKQITKAAKSQS